MDSLRNRRKAVPANLIMKNTDKLMPAMTFVQRPVSTTTDFYDTEFEASSDDESPRMSMDSYGYDSNSTLSTPELPTPDRAPREPFSFNPDKLVRGPSGPHLFRSSISSIGSARSVPTTEIDLYFERSPVNSQFPQSSTTTQFSQSTDSRMPHSAATSQFTHSTNETLPQTAYSQPTDDSRWPRSAATTQFSQSTDSKMPHSAATSQFTRSTNETLPQTAFSQSRDDSRWPRSASTTQFSHSTSETPSTNRFPFSPCTPKALATLQPDVSMVEEAEIRAWSPGQVAHWLHIAGYDDSVVENFILNDINGAVLLNLQIDDLKELSIHSFGKRYQVMGSIDHLRSTMRKSPVSSRGRRTPPSPERRSYQMSVSPNGEVLSHQLGAQNGNQITPAESVSIVGIEQLIPKPHSCSKGENCSKYRKRQRQLEKIKAEFPGAVFLPNGTIVMGNPGNPETAQNLLRPKSDAQPSVVASSDVFGPEQATPRLSEASLSEVEKIDPQEKMRQFLNYQHVEDDEDDFEPVSEQAPTQLPQSKPTTHIAANLRNLPKLMIPSDSNSDEPNTANAQRTITPSMANQMYGSPTAVQEYGPFTGRYIPPHDCYRQGTPFSEMDVPTTAIPNGPVSRETSQSVPPDMRYGNLLHQRDPIMRSASTRPGAGTPLRRVHENRPLTPIEVPEDLKRSPRLPHHAPSSSNSSLSSNPDVTRSGYMKKRKTTKFLRHEWQNAHFTLRGTNLAMHKDELEAHRASRALDSIDVDDYAVACSSLATSSKLSAAFKKSILRGGHNLSHDDAAFAFSLIPSTKEHEKKVLFGHKDGKSHHFAVKTRDERIDWMRELMLAKALKKGREEGGEMQVNGNFI